MMGAGRKGQKKQGKAKWWVSQKVRGGGLVSR